MLIGKKELKMTTKMTSPVTDVYKMLILVVYFDYCCSQVFYTL